MEVVKSTMTTRDASSMHEQSVAKALGGRQTAGSGAAAFSKGDVRLQLALIECKTVMKEQSQVTVQREWLPKIKKEAFAMNKQVAAVCINFGPGTENCYIVDEQTMRTFLDLLQQDIDQNG